MVVLTVSVHPRSLSPANKLKVLSLRNQGYTYSGICDEVVNQSGEAPGISTVEEICKTSSARSGVTSSSESVSILEHAALG